MVKGIKYILDGLNIHIRSAVLAMPNYQGYILHTLATSAVKGNTVESYPVVFDLNGEGVYVGVDDIQPFIGYHKCNRMRSADNPNLGYGDDVKKLVVYEMTFFAFMDRKKLQTEADEFILLLENNFPDNQLSVVESSFTRLKVEINSVILNTSQVFSMEYKNVPFFVRPEHSLIAVSYTIEGTLKKNCFNLP